MIRSALIALGLMATWIGATATTAMGRESATGLCGGSQAVVLAQIEADGPDCGDDLGVEADESSFVLGQCSHASDDVDKNVLGDHCAFITLSYATAMPAGFAIAIAETAMDGSDPSADFGP